MMDEVDQILTNRFMSASSSLTVIKLRIIRPIRSSLQITISWPKYRIRQGLLTNLAFGIRAVSREVNIGGREGRGRV
jgi:hypothetical protein